MKKGISLFYILTLLLLVAQSSLFAGASLEVTPHDVKVQAGSEFTVSINLESDTSIMSLMAILQWDDSVIEPVEYIVPTEFDDPDNISTGWIEDSTMAIIGVEKSPSCWQQRIMMAPLPRSSSKPRRMPRSGIPLWFT